MGYRRSGAPWTADEDVVLRMMFANGATDHEIARAVGRTASATKQHRRLRLGLLREELWEGFALALANSADHRPERQTVPSPHLEPHYRPWPCPSVTKRTEIEGTGACWSAWLPMRARMAELEQRDAERDARDRELYVFDADGRWVGRRDEVAA